MPPDVPDLGSLYDAHARRVWRTLVRLGVPSASVEDAVQDVFLTAHQRLAGFRGAASPSTWLLGIAVRVAANLRRSSRLRVLEPVDEALPDGAQGLEEHVEARRRLAELQRLLAGLPDEQREAIVLVDFEQLTAPEAAEVLDVSVNTVSSRLRLGRAALRRALTPAAQEVVP